MSESTFPLSATKKDIPYIWVTWLTPLLAGASFCQWSAWFQANYKFEKPDADFNEWSVKHGRLLNNRIRALEAEGYKVYVEDENKFTIVGHQGKTKVGGKADIVAIKNGHVIVEDCKTGRKKDSDVMQVLAYMLLLPRGGGPLHCRGKQIEGRLVYGEELIDISAEMLTEDFKKSFRELVHTASVSTEARKVPSERECKYCKISNIYCPEKLEKQNFNEPEEYDDLF